MGTKGKVTLRASTKVNDTAAVTGSLKDFFKAATPRLQKGKVQCLKN